MNSVIHYFTTLHLHMSTPILVTAYFSALIPILLQATKHKFVVGDRFVLNFWKLHINFDAKRVIVTLLGLLSFSASAAVDYLHYASQGLGAVTGEAAIIFTVATYVHRFAVSPLYHRIFDGLNSAETYFSSSTSADTSSSGNPNA